MYKVRFTLLDCKYCVSTLSYRVYKHFKIIINLFVKLYQFFMFDCDVWVLLYMDETDQFST